VKTKKLIGIYSLGIVLLILFAQKAFPQIIVSSDLIDSLIVNTIKKNEVFTSPDISGYTNRFVIRIQQNPDNKNNIFFSYTYVILRRDYPADANIYYFDKQYYFVLFDEVAINKELELAIKRPNTASYQQLMDSLEFTYRRPYGLAVERRKLVVYKVSKSWCSRRKYKITSKTYIPFSSAPKKYWPIISFSDEVVPNTKFSSLYIDARHRFTDLYYKEIEPIKPIKFRLSRK
jgi:hypothetical protein